jgi:hypothetical protein
MPEPNSTIFRERALRVYLENKQKIVVPRFVQPAAMRFLWALVGLLALGAALAWFTEVPVHVSGTGLLVKSEPDSQSRSSVVLLSLLPPHSLARLEPDQRVLARIDGSNERVVARVSSVEVQVLSPDAIRERFALSDALGGLVTGPAAVAVAEIEAVPGGLPAATFAGSASRVDVTVGTRRLISLAPLPGSWR